MSSAEFRSARSLERFLRTLVLGAAASASACGWVPGQDIVRVRALPPFTPVPVDATPGYDTCAAYCGGPVQSCQFATLALTPKAGVPLAPAREPPPPKAEPSQRTTRFGPRTSPPLATRLTTESVVICEDRLQGHFQTFGSFGRRLSGATSSSGAPRSAADHYFQAACAETAAIVAFQQLAFDLEALGAPSALVLSARRSARDEARHARLSLSLARRFDTRKPADGRTRLRSRELGVWPRLPPAVRRVPSLFEVALDNAVSGCATEAVGTWLQLFQARHASDAEVRAIARSIARDEARHTALAFRLAAWCDQRLSVSERARIRDAMSQELRTLTTACRLPAPIGEPLGLPGQEATDRAVATIARALLGELDSRPIELS